MTAKEIIDAGFGLDRQDHERRPQLANTISQLKLHYFVVGMDEHTLIQCGKLDRGDPRGRKVWYGIGVTVEAEVVYLAMM